MRKNYDFFKFQSLKESLQNVITNPNLERDILLQEISQTQVSVQPVRGFAILNDENGKDKFEVQVYRMRIL